MVKDITSLYFGMAAAEKEAALNPERFMKTYLDIWTIEEKVLKNRFFLVLGPKGSGKTAAGLFSELVLKKHYGSEKVLSMTKNMDELAPGISPIHSITSKLVGEQSQGITTSAWKLYIALQFAAFVMADNSNQLSRSSGFIRLWNDLSQAGLVSETSVTADFPTVLRRVRENNLHFSFKLFGGGTTSRDNDEISVSQLGNSLIDIILSSSTDTHYQLMIDGLDRIISDNSAYWLSISSLLMAASDIHTQILSHGSNIHLIIMCRTDVFRKAGFVDADKIAGDSSIFVDWATQQTRVQDSYLWDYLAKKAGIEINELFSLIPDKVIVGQRNKHDRTIDGLTYLLSSTRCTPREVTLLMQEVQAVTPRGQAVTGERLRDAVDNFASRGLLNILMAETSGILSSSSKSALRTILSSFPRAGRVEYSDLELAVKSANLDPGYITEIGEFLFSAGILGNLNVKKEYVQFYYRRDTYTFNPRGPWALHRGIMYAYNIPY